MRIEHVIAHSFGPLRDQKLSFAPGLNVFYGLNEAGKSSWHAAIRSALVGVRRGKGKPGPMEREFAELHKPWSGSDEWRVEAQLKLDDGRQIHIRQDLAEKVDSRAIDMGLGRDVSRDIIHDGSPDASAFLGLDRESFSRTVWVEQGAVVLAGSDGRDLQIYLQRAATSQRGDATAADALHALDAFERNQVGHDNAPTKPLRQTRERLEESREALKEARKQHTDYLNLASTAQERCNAHEGAEVRLRAMRAALARRKADELSRSAQRAQELAASHSAEPPSLVQRDELSDRIASVISAWSRRPATVPLSGPTVEELAKEIAALPDHPQGDLRPDSSVTAAHDQLSNTRAALQALGPAPYVPDRPATGGLDAGDLRSLASDLAVEIPVADQAAIERTERLRRELASLRAREWLPIFGAVGLLVTAAVCFFLGIGVLVAIAGLLSVGLAVVFARTRARIAVVQREIAQIDQSLAPTFEAAAIARSRREGASARASAADIAADPQSIRTLASALEAYEQARRDAATWQRRWDEESALVSAAEDLCRDALEVRAPGLVGSVDERYNDYVEACAEREERELKARRRGDLERAITARRQVEDAAAASGSRLRDLESELRSVAVAAGVTNTAEPDDLVARLRQWQQQESERSAQGQQALAEWQELRLLLGGGTLEQLQGRATEASRLLDELSAGLHSGMDLPTEVSDAKLDELDTDEKAAQAAAIRAEEQRDHLAVTMPDVADAEERVAQLEEELVRITSLDEVVSTTIRLLEAAQEKVHRDLAPILAATVKAYLPVVTGDRYTDVIVDPGTLSVQVKEAASGAYREAARLSGGTREQVYVLLRIALAQHLSTTGETIPLILDEVTAQCDTGRARALMTVLAKIAEERQVIVFSHDRAVLEEARSHLTPADACEELPACAVAV